MASSSALSCPNCGEPVAADDFQCAACELLLDPDAAIITEPSVIRAILAPPLRRPTSDVPRAPSSASSEPLGLGDETPSGVTTALFSTAFADEDVPQVVGGLELAGSLSEFDAYVTSFVDGRKTVLEIARASRLGGVEVRAVLQALEARQIVTLQDPSSERDRARWDGPTDPAGPADVPVAASSGAASAGSPASPGSGPAPEPPPEAPAASSTKLPPWPRIAPRARRDGATRPPSASQEPASGAVAPAPSDAREGAPTSPPPKSAGGSVAPAPSHAREAAPASAPAAGASGVAARPTTNAPPKSANVLVTPYVGAPTPRAPPRNDAAAAIPRPAPASGQPSTAPTARPASAPVRERPSFLVGTRTAEHMIRAAPPRLVPSPPPAPAPVSGPRARPRPLESLEQPAVVDNEQNVLQRAIALERSGEFDGAIHVLKRGISRVKNPAALYNRLALVLISHKRSYEEAEALLRQALELDPDNRVYTQNLYKVVALSAARSNSGKKDVGGFLARLTRRK